MNNLLPSVKGVDVTERSRGGFAEWKPADANGITGKIPTRLEEVFTSQLPSSIQYSSNRLPEKEPNDRFIDDRKLAALIPSPICLAERGEPEKPSIIFEPPKAPERHTKPRNEGSVFRGVHVMRLYNVMPTRMDIYVQRHLTMQSSVIDPGSTSTRLLSGQPHYAQDVEENTMLLLFSTVKRITVTRTGRQEIKSFEFRTGQQIGMEVEMVNHRILCSRVVPHTQASAHEKVLDGAEVVAVNGARVLTLDEFRDAVATAQSKADTVVLMVACFIGGKGKMDNLLRQDFGRKTQVKSLLSNLFQSELGLLGGGVRRQRSFDESEAESSTTFSEADGGGEADGIRIETQRTNEGDPDDVNDDDNNNNNNNEHNYGEEEEKVGELGGFGIEGLIVARNDIDLSAVLEQSQESQESQESQGLAELDVDRDRDSDDSEEEEDDDDEQQRKHRQPRQQRQREKEGKREKEREKDNNDDADDDDDDDETADARRISRVRERLSLEAKKEIKKRVLLGTEVAKPNFAKKLNLFSKSSDSGGSGPPAAAAADREDGEEEERDLLQLEHEQREGQFEGVDQFSEAGEEEEEEEESGGALVASRRRRADRSPRAESDRYNGLGMHLTAAGNEVQEEEEEEVHQAVELMPSQSLGVSRSSTSDSAAGAAGQWNYATAVKTNEYVPFLSVVCVPKQFSRSMRWGVPKKHLQVSNYSSAWNLEVNWVDKQGILVPKKTLKPGEIHFELCSTDHVWAVVATSATKNKHLAGLDAVDKFYSDEQLLEGAGTLPVIALLKPSLSAAVVSSRCVSVLWSPWVSMSATEREHTKSAAARKVHKPSTRARLLPQVDIAPNIHLQVFDGSPSSLQTLTLSENSLPPSATATTSSVAAAAAGGALRRAQQSDPALDIPRVKLSSWPPKNSKSSKSSQSNNNNSSQETGGRRSRGRIG